MIYDYLQFHSKLKLTSLAVALEMFRSQFQSKKVNKLLF